MAVIKTVRIHPAIGIARLGNSPDFFIGPLRPRDYTPPAGGYKDGNCKVKRQAAQFRLFGYDAGGNLVKEITAADGPIKWTAHLVNRKAAADPGFNAPGPRNPSITNPADRANLVIDPGSRTLSGANQQASFDTGTFTLPGPFTAKVPLGEIRTDNDGRLLVLGGSGTSGSPNGTAINDLFNNVNWYDDVSDGPISAAVTIGANSFTAEGSWVIVGPPKFGPPIPNSITLWDRLMQFFIDQGMVPPFSDPSPSYVKYIHPILESARDVYGVVNVGGAHLWTEPVIDPGLRTHIFNKLKPMGNMPMLNSAQLTATQLAIMTLWRDGSFTNDWPPPPPGAITPDGMDRAALEAAVGAAFFPGIEAGDFLVSNKSNYTAPFRLDQAVVIPGKVSERMSLPWQTDFNACSTNWWPPQRPNSVIPSGTTTYQDWARGVSGGADMVKKWSILGFVVDQSGELREVERCDSPFIHLLTPLLNFKDVPQAPMGMSRKTALAIDFEVGSPAAAITLEYVSGPSHPRLQRLGAASVSVGPTGAGIANARLWITYETGTVGEMLTDSVVVHEPASGQQWTIDILANTVARRKAAAALVLDRSGSMIEDRGDGNRKVDSLRQAASNFVDVMLQDDAVALVRFNQDAQLLAGVTALGSPADPFDSGRTTIKGIINSNALDPNGSTSIGDGIFEGRNALNAASGFDVNSIVVLTDGVENQSRFIADVASSINEFTYSIGLGKPENISVPALQAISGNHGGYLLVTGAITGDNQFLLQKYFLQILAGISNAEIVLDPQGELFPGKVVKIPFQLTEADAGVDVILLSPRNQIIDFRIQTPAGYLLGPLEAPAHSDVQYVSSTGLTYYRIRVPFEYLPARFDDRGEWHAVLHLSRDLDGPRRVDALRSNPLAFTGRQTPLRAALPLRDSVSSNSFPPMRAQAAADAVATAAASGVPYSVLVHAYSDIRLRANVQQDTTKPGAQVEIDAVVTEYDVPRTSEVVVWADVTLPKGGPPIRVDLKVVDDHFAGSFVASRPGVYRVRVQASGRSMGGWLFRREVTLTASTFFETSDPGDPQRGVRNARSLLELVGQLKSGGTDVDDLIARLKRELDESQKRDE
jgi:hypothetical protein